MLDGLDDDEVSVVRPEDIPLEFRKVTNKDTPYTLEDEDDAPSSSSAGPSRSQTSSAAAVNPGRTGMFCSYLLYRVPELMLQAPSFRKPRSSRQLPLQSSPGQLRTSLDSRLIWPGSSRTETSISDKLTVFYSGRKLFELES